ncbi:MAG: MFS transporter [Erythrobacter sp.]|uniref:MFS transporter n=1 Tax=Erythrobacter sp. TaxID=1042 RepID=UPI003267DACA
MTSKNPTHPLQVHNFRAYLTSRFSMTLGQYAMILIIGWQTYNLARDAGMSIGAASGQLALIGLLQFLPLFVLTPFTGLAADRFDRRILALLTILLQMLCAGTLGWFTYAGTLSLPILFGVAVLLGIARGFAGPAYSALAPNLVPKTLLPTAIAVSTVAWQLGTILGAAMGGYLYSLSPALPYGVGFGLYVVGFIALSSVGKVPQPAMKKDQRPIGAIVDGLQYVGRNKMVLGAITLDLLAVFLAGANALLPVFARDILEVGADGLAQLAMAPGIGAALTAAYFSFRPLKTQVGPKMLWAVFVFGLATIAFAFSRNMAFSLAMLFIIGSADMFSVYVRQSLIQLHTPDDKRGRVSAVSQMTISASNEGGDAFSGALAYAIGPVAALIAGGAGAIVTVLLWSRIFPVLRTTKTFDPPDDLLEGDQQKQTQAQTQ